MDKNGRGELCSPVKEIRHSYTGRQVAAPTDSIRGRCIPHSSFLIAHYSFLITHCSLLIPHYSLLITHSSFLIALSSPNHPNCTINRSFLPSKMPQNGVFAMVVDIEKEKSKKIANSGEKTLKKYPIYVTILYMGE